MNVLQRRPSILQKPRSNTPPSPQLPRNMPSFVPKGANLRIILADYFYKKGDIVQSWKKRYFVMYEAMWDPAGEVMPARDEKHKSDNDENDEESQQQRTDNDAPPHDADDALLDEFVVVDSPDTTTTITDGAPNAKQHKLYYIQYYTSQAISQPKNEKGTIHPLKELQISSTARKANETGLIIKTDAKRVFHLSAPEGALAREWVRLGNELLGSIQRDTSSPGKTLVEQHDDDSADESDTQLPQIHHDSDTDDDTTHHDNTTTTTQTHPHHSDTDSDVSDSENTISTMSTGISAIRSTLSKTTRPLNNIRIPFSKQRLKLNRKKQSTAAMSTSLGTDSPESEHTTPPKHVETPADEDEEEVVEQDEKGEEIEEDGEEDEDVDTMTTTTIQKNKGAISFDDDDSTDQSDADDNADTNEQTHTQTTNPNNTSPRDDSTSSPHDSDKESHSHSPTSDDDDSPRPTTKRRGSHIIISARRTKKSELSDSPPPQEDNIPTPPPLVPHLVGSSLPQLLEEVKQSQAERDASQEHTSEQSFAADHTHDDTSHVPQTPALLPDQAPVDFMDPSKPLDIHQKLFSDRDIADLLTQDRAARRMNHRLSRRKFISSIIYVDTLHLQKEKAVLSTMQNFGDVDIHFSGFIKKSASGNKYLERAVAVTSQSILFFYRRETNMLGVEGASFGKVLNSFDITKKKVSYDFKERIEMQGIQTLLLSQSPEQKNLVSILLSEGEHDVDIVLDFTKQPSDSRDDFIRQLMNAFRMHMNKKLECITVYNILEYTRLTKGQSKPTPVSVEDDEVIRTTDADFFKVTDKLQFRTIFKQYGDNIVFFSQVAEKLLLKNTGVVPLSLKQELERLIVVTNRALYNCAISGETPIKRRVELEDIGDIVIDSHDDTSVLIVIPSEYDMILKIPKRKVFVEVMEKMLISCNFRTEENVSRLAQLSKTAYIQKQKRNNDPERIRKNLLKGMQYQDKHQLKKFLERAKQNRMLDDAVVVEAQKVCKEIDQADMLRREWNKAWRENDLSYMGVILKRARNISIMQEFAAENTLKFNQIINTKLLTQKMRDAILIGGDDGMDEEDTSDPERSAFDMKHIQYLFDLSLRTGLSDLVEEFRVRLETQVQNLSTIRYAKEYLEKRDRDGLILTLENAELLHIADNYHIFDEVRRMIPVLAAEDRIQKQLEVHIEKALEYDDAESLEKEFDRVSAQFTLPAEFSQRVRDTINYIQQRRQKKKQFSDLINSDSTPHKVLLQWIEETSSDDYFDTLCLLAQKKVHSHAFELERKKQIGLIKDKFKSVLNAYKITQRLNEDQLRQMIESCRHFPELELQIKAAETLLSNLAEKRKELQQQEQQQYVEHEYMKRILQEETLIKICQHEAEEYTSQGGTLRNMLFQDKYSRLNDIITLKQEISEAVASQNRKMLTQLIAEGERIEQIQGVVEKAKEALAFMERQDEYSAVLNDMLTSFAPAKQVEEFIISNRKNFSEELLLKARAVWETTCDREQRVAECVNELETTLKGGASAALREAIQRASPYLEYSEELRRRVQHANTILEQGTTTAASATQQPAPQKRNISDNVHINELHSITIQLLQTFGPDDINSRGKFPVTPTLATPLYQKIYAIVSSRLRKFVFRERTFWDVCKNLQMQGTQYAVRSFEAHMPPEKDLHLQSFYFIQFMLQQDFFTHCMQELFASAPGGYIGKCYYGDSILAQDRYREELNTIFLLLHQFEFGVRPEEVAVQEESNLTTETALAPQPDAISALFADPVALLKVAVQQLVAFVYQLYQNAPDQSSAPIASDKHHESLRPLIANLTNSLLEVLQSSRKRSITQTHFWNIIKKIARNKETTSVSNFGGLALPEAVEHVEQISNLHALHDGSALSNGAKFYTFVCHALNTRQLGVFFETILQDVILQKYYTGSHAYVLNPSTREVIVSLLHKMDYLEFRLSAAGR